MEVGGYTVDRPIAHGHFGSVHLGHRTSKKDEIVALKRTVKSISKVSLKTMKREVAAGKKLVHHENLALARSIIETEDSHWLVLDYVGGIDLIAFMEDRDLQPLSEERAKHIFKQLVEALLHCHKEGVAHRDVKLDNLMITKEDKVKLIDFGLCHIRSWKSKRLCDTAMGSMEYCAPEVRNITAPYCPFLADVWSCGIVLYCLLFGQFPFDDNEQLRISNGEKIEPANWTAAETMISSEARNLLRAMLEVNPKARIVLEEVKKHPWLQKDKKEEEEEMDF